MQTETLKCSGCGAPLVPEKTTSIACNYCKQINYVRPSDALGPMAELDLRVTGAKCRFTDSIVVTTSAPATLSITSMLDNSITGSIVLCLAPGDLTGQVIDMAPKYRTSENYIINLIDMSVPTTYTNMATSMSAVMDPSQAPDLGGMVHVTQFDLTSGQCDLKLVDIRLAKIQTNTVCTINGTIRTFRSVNPLVV